MSGEEPGYVPPDHKRTAEFRVPGKAAMADAGTAADSTVVDGPVDDLAEVTFQDFPEDDPEATSLDLPADDPEDEPEDDPGDDPGDEPGDEPGATFQDLPGGDPAATSLDGAGDDPGVTFRDGPGDGADKASVTVSDIRIEKPAASGQGAVPPRPDGRPPVPEQPVPEQPGEAPWTARFGAEGETASPAGAPFASPMPAPAPVPAPVPARVPPPDATAPAMPSGGAPVPRSRRPMILIAVIVAVVLLAAAVLTALLYAGREEKTGKPASPAASAPAAGGATDGPAPTAPGTPSPGGAPATPPAAAPTAGRPPVQPGTPPPATTAPIGPLVQGKGITYQLVQQDDGYFEGRMVITNRTDRPMKTWKLTFRAPGADVKNIWGARLVHGGEKVEIKNLDGAPAIPPGGTWEVQFGAAGHASTPKGCELNGKACGL